ncbi:hypothetical protein FDP41_000579 [Naegleria fowleri]|uniref:RRM domain-containing protein n=1 Tax=Naegleria fowleri TaxID=5763 RepID=A0A6A5CGM7_NAEFO|nr:uncharacterized protein FDP41_000579 [Naegleria fowleri]KAF0984680.1 hypothetical protein FDP41_000579 [Naegleria fowleri]CAG4718084.1 unnamed protein product [Naegleria fowleri]
MPKNVIQTPTFTIVEDISSSEDEREEEENTSDEEERIQKLLEETSRKKKRKKGDDVSADSETKNKKTKLPSLNVMDNFDQEVKIGEVKVAKPIDYEQLKQSEQTKGVIYISTDFGKNPIPPTLKDEKALRKMLAEFGTVARVESKYERRGLRHVRVGFYVEFEDKNIAKRVALTLNGSTVSRSDSRMYSVKFLPHFEWSEVGEEEELQKMKRKLLKVEAQTELRAIKEFKKNKKWSESIKNDKAPKPNSNFRFNQKAVIRHDNSTTSHIDTLKIFAPKDDSKQSKKN